MFNIRKYLIANKSHLFVYFTVGLFKNISAFLLSISIGEFFTVYFHSNGAKSRLLNNFGISFHSLESFFLTFIVLLLLKALLEFFERYICFKQGELLVKDLRMQTFSLQMNMQNEKFKEKYFGKYLLRYSNDMKSIQNYYTKGILEGTRDIMFVIMGFFLLSIINFKLDLFYIFFSFIVLFLIYLFSKKQKPYITESRSKRSGLLSLVAKSFQRHRIIKENKSEDHNIKRFLTKSTELYEKNMRNNRFESLMQSLFSFSQYLIILFLLIIMSMKHIISIDSSNALIFILIVLLLNAPMKRILKIPSIINKGKISFQKINELYEVQLQSSL